MGCSPFLKRAPGDSKRPTMLSTAASAPVGVPAAVPHCARRSLHFAKRAPCVSHRPESGGLPVRVCSQAPFATGDSCFFAVELMSAPVAVCSEASFTCNFAHASSIHRCKAALWRWFLRELFRMTRDLDDGDDRIGVSHGLLLTATKVDAPFRRELVRKQAADHSESRRLLHDAIWARRLLELLEIRRSLAPWTRCGPARLLSPLDSLGSNLDVAHERARELEASDRHCCDDDGA